MPFFYDKDAGPDGAGLSNGIAPLGRENHTHFELTEYLFDMSRG